MTVEWQIKRKVRRWVRRAGERVFPPTYLLGRVACLGQEVHRRKITPSTRRVALLNMQKVRCDVILEWLSGANRMPMRARADVVKTYLARADIAYLLDQQERMIWFERRLPIDTILMDSFAELTDQRFRHRRDGWTFACHYSDLNHTPEFHREFECLGLLPLADIEPTYRRFFEWTAATFPTAPLIFLHFPATLDDRPQFKERAAVIANAVEKLASVYPNLRSVRLADDEVAHAPEDDFPYHFSHATLDRFAARWTQLEASPPTAAQIPQP
jgi:hypothetical protein